MIIGPSGAGKSTVLERLVEAGVAEVLPTWTTRPPRGDETGGSLEHVFCSTEEFAKAKADGKFLHTDTAFGLSYEYGLPMPTALPKDKVLIVMLRVMVLEPLYKFVKNPIIYQIEADEARAKKVLEQRSEDSDIGRRLTDYVREMEAGRQIAKRVFVNDSIERVTAEILEAIKKDFEISKA